jgi:hypothetical protein
MFTPRRKSHKLPPHEHPGQNPSTPLNLRRKEAV